MALSFTSLVTYSLVASRARCSRDRASRCG
jgi:hypothetical protein